jgi:hypothetical protein
MAELSFGELAEIVLEEQNIPLSPVEIWEIAVSKGYDKLVASKGKTPWQTIGARLYVDIRDNPNTHFIKVDSTPKRFFLRKLSGEKPTPPMVTKALPDFPQKTKSVIWKKIYIPS